MRDLSILLKACEVRAILERGSIVLRRMGNNRGETTSSMCQYGEPGDTMWVRETWAPFDAKAFRDRDTKPDRLFYRADDESKHKHKTDGAWRSSVHMPRWASRITLRVTSRDVDLAIGRWYWVVGFERVR